MLVKHMNQNKNSLLQSLTSHTHLIFLVLIFISHVFFRFYNLENWASFNWDQVDNAWAAAKILIAHKYPLVGMVAKQNSGMYIGPLYYYLVAFVYKLTDMHPIAAPILAAVTSLFSFTVVYSVTKKLFSPWVGVWATVIYTFSAYITGVERSQWPVNFLPAFSLLILYNLYRLLTGNPKYGIYLAIVMGLFFHIHFTAIFYPMIVFCTFPFLKWDRKHLKYYGISLMIFFLFFVPQIVYYTQAAQSGSINNYSGYFATYYHGFHARRVLQLAPDAFIKFQSIMQVPYEKLKLLMFLYVPIFFFALLWKDKSKKTWLLCLVTALWFVIPWFVFSTYKGELTDYYFSSTLYVAIMILAWLSHALWMRKMIVFRVALLAFWGYFAVANYYQFMGSDNKQEFRKNYISALEAADGDRYYNYADGDPKSYMYYYHMYKLKKELPYKL